MEIMFCYLRLVVASGGISNDAAVLFEAFGGGQQFGLDDVVRDCGFSRRRAADIIAELTAAGIVTGPGRAMTIRFGAHSAIQGLMRARSNNAGTALDTGLINARAVLDD